MWNFIPACVDGEALKVLFQMTEVIDTDRCCRWMSLVLKMRPPPTII